MPLDMRLRIAYQTYVFHMKDMGKNLIDIYRSICLQRFHDTHKFHLYDKYFL